MIDQRDTARVIVVGEALIDIVHRADGTVTETPGGSPANVALTLGRLGVPVRLVTQLADNAGGRAVRAWLVESGAQVSAQIPDGGRTSTAIARLDATGAATYEFDVTWSITVPELGAVGALQVGSLGGLLVPDANAVASLVAAVGDALVSNDPGIRPSLIGDPVAARSRVERLVAAAAVVKASEGDLRWLYPLASPVHVARRWRAAGPALAQVLRRCAHNAAITVSRAGADPPWASEIETTCIDSLPATTNG
ncbi:fructokinase [Parafrankia sp. EAN1pec]|uniref:PfkB family carbohydrate kinase n=1 Tax=Parafrankia sp. (strain EAN1pec) TaxID=298653 RepID=UPI00015DA14F|nr:fructokinase [Frankia sp. EAN1pec]